MRRLRSHHSHVVVVGDVARERSSCAPFVLHSAALQCARRARRARRRRFFHRLRGRDGSATLLLPADELRSCRVQRRLQRLHPSCDTVAAR